MTDLPKPEWFVKYLKEGSYFHESKKYANSGMFHGLFTATQMREYRNQALEEAAKVCEQRKDDIGAERIRALKGEVK